MSFSCEDNDISRFSMMDRIGNSLLTVRDLYIFTIGFRHSDLDIIDDGLRIFITWIIRSDDREICHLAGNLTHLIAAELGAVSPTSKQAYQSVRVIFLQCSKKALKRHGIVRIIDHQRKFVGYLDHLNTTFHLGYFQRFDDILFRYFEMTADGDGCQGIVNTEFARNIDLHRKIKKSLYMVGNSKISFSSHQFRIFCTEIRFFRKSVCLKLTGMAIDNTFGPI